MLNFLGVTENFAVIENQPFSMVWTFTDAWTGEPVSLDGVTFAGKVYIGPDRREIELDLSKGETPNDLAVACTGLPEGRWPYEVFCISDEGLRERMLSGSIGVIGTLEPQTLFDSRPAADRTLTVRLPGDTVRALKLEWLSTSAAQSAAASAWKAWESVQATADGLADAEGRLDSLNAAAQDAMDKLQQADCLVDDLHSEVQNAQEAAQKAQDLLESGILQGEKGDTPDIGENGNWWISGTDTGIRAEGRDGLTPHVGENGHWYVGEMDTQIQAEGADGRDADAIERIYVSSTEELPEDGAPGIYYCIPAPGGGCDVYAWVHYPDGESAWTPISETTLRQATVREHGTVRLSTGTLLTEGGIVGVNEAGQLLARPASAAVPGAVRLSTSSPSPIAPGLVGVNGNGQLIVPEATVNQAGVIKIDNTKNIERGARVQTDRNNLAMIPVAGNRSYGVVATGTQYPVIPHERPYIVSLPVAGDDTRLNAAALYGTLTINLHRRGFLRYTSGSNAENGLDYATGRYLSLDYGTGLEAEPYTSSVEGITDTRFRLAVTRYPDIVFHDTYGTPDKGGSVKIGATLSISGEGSLNVKPAAPGLLGGIRVGATLAVTEDGTLDLRLDAQNFDEQSPRPASSAAIAAWLKSRNYVTRADLQSNGYISENRVKELLNACQPRMSIRDTRPLTQEEYDRLDTLDADTLYIIY